MEHQEEEIEKYRHLQREITDSYNEKAYGGSPDRKSMGNKSQSKTPERNQPAALSGRNQTQEKHHFQHLLDQDMRLQNQKIVPKVKDKRAYLSPKNLLPYRRSPARFHLNLEELDPNAHEEMATGGKRIDPLISSGANYNSLTNLSKD